MFGFVLGALTGGLTFGAGVIESGTWQLTI